MKNPWTKLPNNGFFALSDDKIVIDRFKKKLRKSQYKIHFELLPEPFLGNKEASIVLLNLNPGYSIKDKKYHVKDAQFRRKWRKCILHKSCKHPFYLLDPQLREAPGSVWWNKKLKNLIDMFDSETVSNNLLCVEYFPYHSKKYHRIDEIMSQRYNFQLVEQAIKRNALIIILRSEKLWEEKVKLLKGYKNRIDVKNHQNVTITHGNLTRNGFVKIVKILKARKKPAKREHRDYA